MLLLVGKWFDVSNNSETALDQRAVPRRSLPPAPLVARSHVKPINYVQNAPYETVEPETRQTRSICQQRLCLRRIMTTARHY